MVADAIAQTGATAPKDMGAVMKVVMDRAGGLVDGKRASAAVRAALADVTRIGVGCGPRSNWTTLAAAELAGSGDAILRALQGHLDCEVFLRGQRAHPRW